MLGIFKNLFGNKTDFAALVKKGALIIDVRTTAEFMEGHISGSKNIPLQHIRSKIGELKEYKKPVITVCRSGSRSSMAQSILKDHALEAYNGGAWNSLAHKLQKY